MIATMHGHTNPSAHWEIIIKFAQQLDMKAFIYKKGNVSIHMNKQSTPVVCCSHKEKAPTWIFMNLRMQDRNIFMQKQMSWYEVDRYSQKIDFDKLLNYTYTSAICMCTILVNIIVFVSYLFVRMFKNFEEKFTSIVCNTI